MNNPGLRFILSMAAAVAMILGALELLNLGYSNLWLDSIAVFLAAKLGGDMAGVFARTKGTFFYEDFFKEAAIYAGGGLLSAGASFLALILIGGPVTPALPALGMHAAYILGGRSSGELES